MTSAANRGRRVWGAFFISMTAVALFLDAGLRFSRAHAKLEAQNEWREALALQLVGDRSGMLPQGCRICLHVHEGQLGQSSFFPQGVFSDSLCTIPPQIWIDENGAISVIPLTEQRDKPVDLRGALHAALVPPDVGRSFRLRQTLALQALVQMVRPFEPLLTDTALASAQGAGG